MAAKPVTENLLELWEDGSSLLRGLSEAARRDAYTDTNNFLERYMGATARDPTVKVLSLDSILGSWRRVRDRAYAMGLPGDHPRLVRPVEHSIRTLYLSGKVFSAMKRVQAAGWQINRYFASDAGKAAILTRKRMMEHPIPTHFGEERKPKRHISPTFMGALPSYVGVGESRRARNPLDGPPGKDIPPTYTAEAQGFRPIVEEVHGSESDKEVDKKLAAEAAADAQWEEDAKELERQLGL